MANENLFKKFPDSVSSRVKLRGILSDFFPTEKMKVNLILNAYDEGIIDSIKTASELNSILFGRWKKIVVDNYGVSDDNAEWVVDYWFSEYGVAVCGKKYKKPVAQPKPATPKSAPAQKPVAAPQKPASGCVSIAQMKEGDKVPKALVETYTAVNNEVKISSLTCAVRLDYSYKGMSTFKFTGEYTGSSSRYVLIMLMLYNANNELIGFDTDKEIAKDFKGTASFEETVRVPSDEYISRAVIRLTLDPTFA